MITRKGRKHEFYLGSIRSNRGIIGLVRWFRSILEPSYRDKCKVLIRVDEQLPDKGHLPGDNGSESAGYVGHKDQLVGHAADSQPDPSAKAAGMNLENQVGYIREKAMEYILRDEGFNPKPYWDVKRYSIGHGLPQNGRSEITFEESKEEVRQRVEDIISWYASDYCTIHAALGQVRGVVLVCMMYQIGRNGVKNFLEMNKEIRRSNWKAAAYEMYNSNWFWQTCVGINNPANRAIRFVRQMATGKE